MSDQYELSVDPATICRCCLNEHATLQSIYCNQIVGGAIMPMPKVIATVTGCAVRHTDGYPPNICTPCRLALVQAYVVQQKYVTNRRLLAGLMNIDGGGLAADSSKSRETAATTMTAVKQDIVARNKVAVVASGSPAPPRLKQEVQHNRSATVTSVKVTPRSSTAPKAAQVLNGASKAAKPAPKPANGKVEQLILDTKRKRTPTQLALQASKKPKPNESSAESDNDYDDHFDDDDSNDPDFAIGKSPASAAAAAVDHRADDNDDEDDWENDDDDDDAESDDSFWGASETPAKRSNHHSQKTSDKSSSSVPQKKPSADTAATSPEPVSGYFECDTEIIVADPSVTLPTLPLKAAADVDELNGRLTDDAAFCDQMILRLKAHDSPGNSNHRIRCLMTALLGADAIGAYSWSGAVDYQLKAFDDRYAILSLLFKVLNYGCAQSAGFRDVITAIRLVLRKNHFVELSNKRKAQNIYK